jgi:hypothetical protein
MPDKLQELQIGENHPAHLNKAALMISLDQSFINETDQTLSSFMG